MPKRPLMPKVSPVVQRTVLGVALGATGCARNQHMRIGQPPPDEWMRIGAQEAPPELIEVMVQHPGGEPLTNASVTIVVGDQERVFTTEADGLLFLDGYYGAEVELFVEGFEPVRLRPDESFQQVVLQPVQTDTTDDAAPEDGAPTIATPPASEE